MTRDRRHLELSQFGTVMEPNEAMQPILARPVRDALMAWLTEIRSVDALAAVGLTARQRAMFDGPPGVGKTTLAHHLSARLGLTMLAVRPERLIHSYVGSTGRHIGALFDRAAEEPDDPILLFFDEFDAIAIKRKLARQGAEDEQNAWVNTLLQRIEQHRGFLIAATNHSDHVDPAIWRRFDIHMTLQLPGQEERERIIARYLAPYGLPRDALVELATAFETASPALMRQFCEGIKRNIVLGPILGWNMQREAVVDRLVTSVTPHPDLGKPRLWSHGAKDAAVRGMPWPLSMAADLGEPAKPETEETNVVALGARGRATG